MLPWTFSDIMCIRLAFISLSPSLLSLRKPFESTIYIISLLWLGIFINSPSEQKKAFWINLGEIKPFHQQRELVFLLYILLCDTNTRHFLIYFWLPLRMLKTVKYPNQREKVGKPAKRRNIWLMQNDAKKECGNAVAFFSFWPNKKLKCKWNNDYGTTASPYTLNQHCAIMKSNESLSWHLLYSLL